MANFYCDHGAYSSALGTTPTWGVPQEGDGYSKDAATASSIGSIAFSAVPTSGTISVCGASVSTTGVLSAADANTAANTLATNINATTATVSSAAAVGAPQLRNLVYARGPSGGAPAGTCEIMMRVGSATLNYATNSNSAIAHTLNNSPTVVQFAGGSGGCWGWFVNVAAIGVSSSIGIGTYGTWLFKPYVSHAGTSPAKTDPLYHRSGGGASKSIALSTGSGQTWTKATGYSPRHIVDTNTVWTGDSATGTLSVSITSTSAFMTHSIGAVPNTESFYLKALRYKGFALKHGGSSAAVFNAFPVTGASALTLVNVHFQDNNSSGNSGYRYVWPAIVSYATGASLRLLNCCLERTVASSFLNPISYATPSGVYELLIDGGEYIAVMSGISNPGPVLTGGSSPSTRLRISNMAFKGYSAGYDIFTGSYLAQASTSWQFIDIENCPGLAFPAGYFGMPVSGVAMAGGTDFHRFQIRFKDGSFRYENQAGVWEYNRSAANWPYYGATLMDGSTPYSIRCVWVNGVNDLINPATSPLIRALNRLADGTRTLTLEVLVPSGFAPTPGSFDCVIQWQDSSGVAHVETPTLQASAATWTNTPSGYTAMKFEAVTSAAVPQNTEVTAQLYLNASPPSGTNTNLYVDPAIGIV